MMTTNITEDNFDLDNPYNFSNLNDLYFPSNLSNITDLSEIRDLANLIDDTNNLTNFANYTIEVPEVSVTERVLSFVTWFLTNSLGNGMMIGIVQFERFGGDPLKRRVTDQVSHSEQLMWLQL